MKNISLSTANIIKLGFYFFFVCSLLFFTGFFHFLDIESKILGLTLTDFSLLCVAICLILAIILNKASLIKTIQSNSFFAFFLFIPIIVFTSSFAAHLNYSQPLWYGIRPQRFLLLFPALFFALILFFKNNPEGVGAIKTACIIIGLIECFVGFLQLVLSKQIIFLRILYNLNTNRFILMSSPILLGAFFALELFFQHFAEKRNLKSFAFLLVFLIFVLFEVAVTKYRVYMISYFVSFLVSLFIFVIIRNPKIIKKALIIVVPIVCILFAAAVVFVVVKLKDDSSAMARLYGYANFISIIASYPLIGIGFPSTLFAWSTIVSRISNKIYYVDDGLIGFVAIYGLIGLVFVLMFYYGMIKLLTKHKKNTTTLVMIVFLMSFILVSSVTVVPFFCDKNMLIIAVILATLEKQGSATKPNQFFVVNI